MPIEKITQLPSEVPSEDVRVQVRQYYKAGSSRSTKIGFRPSKVCRIKVVRRDKETGVDRVVKTRKITKTESRKLTGLVDWPTRVLMRLQQSTDREDSIAFWAYRQLIIDGVFFTRF